MRFSQLFNKVSKEGSSVLGTPSAADTLAKAVQKHHDELSANGQAEAAGIIATNASGSNTKSEAQKKKDRDEKSSELRQRVLEGIKELERWERALLDKAREIEEGIARKQKLIEKTTQEMMENSDFIGFIKKSQDDFKSGKSVDIDAVKTRLQERGAKVPEHTSVKDLLFVIGQKESLKANDRNKQGDVKIHDNEIEIEQDRVKAQKCKEEAKEINDELYDINNRGFSTEEKDLLIQQAMSKHGRTAKLFVDINDVEKADVAKENNHLKLKEAAEQKASLDELLGEGMTKIATATPKPF